MSQVWINSTFAMGKNLVDFHLCCSSGPADFPVTNFGEGDVSTEAETKRQRRSRSARITHRLKPLAEGASAPIDFRVATTVESYWSRLYTMVCMN